MFRMPVANHITVIYLRELMIQQIMATMTNRKPTETEYNQQEIDKKQLNADLLFVVFVF